MEEDSGDTILNSIGVASKNDGGQIFTDDNFKRHWKKNIWPDRCESNILAGCASELLKIKI